ncbi:MAG: penicillin-binding protein 2 [Verrucomicrobiota bacterium]|nr:penicillin-binding protein 2 [Verrucomicrobiota bacterium]
MRRVPIQARRGDVLDANGQLLATSLPLKKITIDPIVLREVWDKKIKRAQAKVSKAPHTKVPTVNELRADLVYKLSGALGITTAEVQEKIDKKTHYVELKRRVEMDSVEKVKAIGCGQIYFEDDFLRVYPNQELASHVVGFVKGDQKEGAGGIELKWNRELQGKDGWRRTEKDNQGNELVIYRVQDMAPRNGYNITLTIDQMIQHIVETELDKAVIEYRPKAALAIVTRPRTGEIMAMATRPTFNPNNSKTNIEATRNRGITGPVEPGSTFKIVTISAAMNEGLVNLDTEFFCENGKFLYNGKVLHDHESYGTMNVHRGIQASSNILAAKVALELGAAKLHEYIVNFGFGTRTGIPLPGEEQGIFKPVKKWSGISIVHLPMGHEISVTPIQMIMAFGAIANGGLLMKPILVQKVTDQEGRVVQQYYPTVVRRAVSPKAAEMMSEALKSVIEKGGTAEKAAVPGYKAAGKTGTAQKLDPETKRYDTRKDGRVIASFIGYLPADDPEFCVLVMLDEPQAKLTYGGQVAAPMFSNISAQVARHLDIIPAEKSQIAVNDHATQGTTHND